MTMWYSFFAKEFTFGTPANKFTLDSPSAAFAAAFRSALALVALVASSALSSFCAAGGSSCSTRGTPSASGSADDWKTAGMC